MRRYFNVHLLPILIAAVSAGNVWHLLDVPALVCPGGPGVLNLTLTPEDFPSKDLPFIITLYRTSNQQVLLSLNLTDTHGALAVSTISVELPDLLNGSTQTSSTTAVPSKIGEWQTADARRLENSPGDAVAHGPSSEEDSCEAFFLLDGRPPVELPGTWNEAQVAFQEICEGETDGDLSGCAAEAKEVFAQPPAAGQPTLTGDLCSKLMARAGVWLGASVDAAGSLMFPGAGSGFSVAPGRRLKGGYHGTGYSPRDGYLRSTYPAGYRDTSFGFSGRMAYRPGISGPVGIAYPAAFMAGAFSGHHYYSRYHSYFDESSTGVDDAETVCGESVCVKNFTLPEAANRDDLMNTGFYPFEYQFPLSLSIGVVSGADFLVANICPSGTDSSWRAPPQSDLFVTFTRVEDADTGSLISDIFNNLVLIGIFMAVCYTPISMLYQFGQWCYKKFMGLMGLRDSTVVMGPNGQIFAGARVQTQWTREEGGNGQWYPGTARAVHENGFVEIQYDDGDTWTGPASHVYLSGA